MLGSDLNDMLHTSKQLFVFGEYFTGEVPDYSIDKLLNISKKELNKYGEDIIEEKYEDEKLSTYLNKFKISIQSYTQFQDILSFQMSMKKELIGEDIFSGRHYCYYESLVYLRQSVLSLMNLNILSSITLLRPFMELSLFELYWHYFTEEKGLETYYDWMKGERGKPPFKNYLEYVVNRSISQFPKLEECLKEIEELFKNIYSSFSSYNHTPKLSESLAAKAKGLSIPDYEDFLFALHNINILLHQLVILYVVANPMILFPVKEYKKFAFRGPINLFADKCNYKIVRKHLGKENINFLKEILKEYDFVKSNLAFYDQQPELSFGQIRENWKQVHEKGEAPETIEEMIALNKAKNRALYWAFNYAKYQEYFKKDLKEKSKEINKEFLEREFNEFYGC